MQTTGTRRRTTKSGGEVDTIVMPGQYRRPGERDFWKRRMRRRERREGRAETRENRND